MGYPAELLGGVNNSTNEFVTPYGYLTKNVFRIDPYDAAARDDDGYREISVTWLDCEEAIDILKNQLNERRGTQQFQGGYCKINKTKMELILQTYADAGHFKYERRPTEATEINSANPYHGNLLVKNELAENDRVNIQASLATIAGRVIQWED